MLENHIIPVYVSIAMVSFEKKGGVSWNYGFCDIFSEWPGRAA